MNPKALATAVLIGMGVTVVSLVVIHHILPGGIVDMIYGRATQPAVKAAIPVAKSTAV